MTEFFFEVVNCCTIIFPILALAALLLNQPDEALELGVLGAVALGLAAVRRWWRGR